MPLLQNLEKSQIQLWSLLTVIRKECHKIYKTLSLTDKEKKSPKVIQEKLAEEFPAKRNVAYERFLNWLRERAATCKFATLESEMLRDHIVIGINNNVTCKRLLREKDLTLNYTINICKMSEMTVKKLHQMDPSETIRNTKTKPKYSTVIQSTSHNKSHILRAANIAGMNTLLEIAKCTWKNLQQM